MDELFLQIFVRILEDFLGVPRKMLSFYQKLWQNNHKFIIFSIFYYPIHLNSI